MVSVKCKACGKTTTKKRSPTRCSVCGAKFAIVGGELIFDNAQSAAAPKPKTIGAKVEKKKLELEPGKEEEPEKPAVEEKPAEELYDCGSCGAQGVIREGMEKCPKCGVGLDWENVSE